jgi:hypothetical protein
LTDPLTAASVPAPAIVYVCVRVDITATSERTVR